MRWPRNASSCARSPQGEARSDTRAPLGDSKGPVPPPGAQVKQAQVLKTNPSPIFASRPSCLYLGSRSLPGKQLR